MNLHQKRYSKEMEASKSAVMTALDKLLVAKDHFTSAAEEAGLDIKYEAIDRYGKGRAKIEEFSGEAREYAKEKPVTVTLGTLSLIFVVGLLFSLLAKRE
jgi:hypothetical protein